jgi:hypothetical protein
MSTRADIFYPHTGTRDQVYGTDVRKLEVAAQTVVSTTITSHPSAAGTTNITLDPYSTSTTQSDIRNNLGWAVNVLGTGGFDATANLKPRIQAGSWNLQFPCSVPFGGTGIGTLTASFSAIVYRVGVSPSFTRTALFTTAQSSTVASSALAVGTGTCAVTTASQPEIVLEVGETIAVGYLGRVVQVAGIAGAVVAGTATWSTGNALVNPPAIDYITEFVGSATGLGTAAGQMARVLPVVGSAVGSGVAAGALGAVKGTVGAATGLGLADGQLAAVKGIVGVATGLGLAAGQLATVKGMVGTVNIGSGAAAVTVMRPVLILES